MVPGMQTATSSLVLVGSLLLAEQCHASAAASKDVRRRRSVAGGNDNRQLRTRKLSKGVAADQFAAATSSKTKRSDQQIGDIMARNGDLGVAIQPPVLAGCFRDFKMCESTGTLVSRNPKLGCDFDPCPPGEGNSENSENYENNDNESNNAEDDVPGAQLPVNDNNGGTPSSPQQQPQQYHPIQIIEENMPITPGESNNGYAEGDFLLPNGAWVGCDWVTKKTDARCGKMTANNELVSDLCPDVCNAATVVAILEENTPAMTVVDASPNNLTDAVKDIGSVGNFTLASGMIVDCDWVEKRVESRCFKKTNDARQVRYLCPVCTHVVEVVTPINTVDNTTYDGL